MNEIISHQSDNNHPWTWTWLDASKFYNILQLQHKGFSLAKILIKIKKKKNEKGKTSTAQNYRNQKIYLIHFSPFP